MSTFNATSVAGTVFEHVPETQQSVTLSQGAGLAAFQLEPQRALNLRTARAGLLTVLRGRLWATRQQPLATPSRHSAWLDDADAACTGALAWVSPQLSGDIIVQAGQSLPLRAQDRLVVEALHSPQSGPLLFSFEAGAQAGL